MRNLALAGIAAGTALALSLTACSTQTAETTRKEAQLPQVTITPANGTGSVRPGTPITVHVVHGTVRNVRVQTGGDAVTGELSEHGTMWRSTGPLNTSRQFRVVATATGTGGRIVTAASSFQTSKPRRTFKTTTLMGFKQTYGVGMPIILNFSRPITRKAAVERAISIKSSKRIVGAWYWDGDKTLYFRPRTYWPQHTKVSFSAKLDGVEGAKGVYGAHDLTQSFEIGDSLIVVASTRSHYMNVYYKRHFWHRWPISTGRPGDDTPNGTYVTINKGNPVNMVGPGYNLMVPWSVRFTWSGVFIHDAYWSVGEQGVTNVSHGCVNTSPAHSEEYYKLAVPGDPVTVVGSPRPGTWDNGWTVWFLSWKHLLRGSAVGKAVLAGPDGSTFVNPTQLASTHARAPLSQPHPHNARAA
jgi:lipoprotein-anchoring transpeptidase ErfK/SrfK